MTTPDDDIPSDDVGPSLATTWSLSSSRNGEDVIGESSLTLPTPATPGDDQ